MKASLFCTARYVGAAPHDIWPLSGEYYSSDAAVRSNGTSTRWTSGEQQLRERRIIARHRIATSVDEPDPRYRSTCRGPHSRTANHARSDAAEAAQRGGRFKDEIAPVARSARSGRRRSPSSCANSSSGAISSWSAGRTAWFFLSLGSIALCARSAGCYSNRRLVW